jgi:hypothetical protein
VGPIAIPSRKKLLHNLLCFDVVCDVSRVRDAALQIARAGVELRATRNEREAHARVKMSRIRGRADEALNHGQKPARREMLPHRLGQVPVPAEFFVWDRVVRRDRHVALQRASQIVGVAKVKAGDVDAKEETLVAGLVYPRHLVVALRDVSNRDHCAVVHGKHLVRRHQAHLSPRHDEQQVPSLHKLDKAHHADARAGFLGAQRGQHAVDLIESVDVLVLHQVQRVRVGAVHLHKMVRLAARANEQVSLWRLVQRHAVNLLQLGDRKTPLHFFVTFSDASCPRRQTDGASESRAEGRATRGGPGARP